MIGDDTIAALATPAAPAPRAIVRTSGPAAFELAEQLGAVNLMHAHSTRVVLAFADLRVPAECFAFRSPRSHTGEDVVEYHLPGNPLLCRLLLDALQAGGACLARPGEFTARAYFNGRIRLDEAEAVQAAIGATNDAELAAAARLRAGELASRLAPLLDELANMLALCEAGIDFVDEPDVVAISPDDLTRRVAVLQAQISHLKLESGRFEQLARPPTIALVGRPNAGKSTLLNALAGYQRAVVSTVGGTTRDALAIDIDLPGGRVQLLDLAGIGDPTTDPLDAAAGRIAASRIAEADVLALVRAVDDGRPDPDLPRPADVVIITKADVFPQPNAISALTGEGLAPLRHQLSAAAFDRHGGDRLALTARHVAALVETLAALDETQFAIAENAGDEIVAMSLREALDGLGSILGIITPDDLLGRVFATFCVGK